MLTSDRKDFDALISVLCAGYNIPATGDRLDAYWRGLAKMELPTLSRLVDHCLAEGGPEKLPTPRSMWPLARELRAKIAPPAPPPKAWQGDEWLAAGNRHLFAYIVRHAMVKRTFNVEETAILVQAKNAWVEDMRLDTPKAAEQKAAWEHQIHFAQERMERLKQAAA
jgi:hypothetical protein